MQAIERSYVIETSPLFHKSWYVSSNIQSIKIYILPAGMYCSSKSNHLFWDICCENACILLWHHWNDEINQHITTATANVQQWIFVVFFPPKKMTMFDENFLRISSLNTVSSVIKIWFVHFTFTLILLETLSPTSVARCAKPEQPEVSDLRHPFRACLYKLWPHSNDPSSPERWDVE